MIYIWSLYLTKTNVLISGTFVPKVSRTSKNFKKKCEGDESQGTSKYSIGT